MAVKSKSYLNNPALQFISNALVDEATGAQPSPAPVQNAPAAAPAAPVQPSAPSAAEAPSANAAAAAQESTAAAGKFIVPMKPVYVEVRSKRFNALMQPSLYNNLLKIAGANGVSVNELVHRVLEKFVEDNLGE